MDGAFDGVVVDTWGADLIEWNRSLIVKGEIPEQYRLAIARHVGLAQPTLSETLEDVVFVVYGLASGVAHAPRMSDGHACPPGNRPR